jgi:hypothetical protein
VSNYSNSHTRAEPDRRNEDDLLVESSVLNNILTNKEILYEQLHQVGEMAVCGKQDLEQILDNYFAKVEGT